MTTQYTSKLRLPYWQKGDRDWHVQFADAMNLLDALEALGALAVRTHENPSTTLGVDVAAGVFLDAAGSPVSYAGDSNFPLTASSTNSLYLTDAGVLTNSTTGFPASTNIVPLAVATTDGSTVTAVTLARRPWRSGGGDVPFGPFSAGDDSGGAVTIHSGTTNGTKIGGATTEKLGFFNATPIVQPANTVELVTLLVNLGLRAAGGNPALNLGSGALASGNHTLSDGAAIVVGTTTGTQIGTIAAMKLSFWGQVPTVKPVGASQAALGTLTMVTMTDSTTGTASDTLSDVGASFSQAAINNNFAALAREINRGVADLASVKTLLNQIRSDLITIGLIKGSA